MRIKHFIVTAVLILAYGGIQNKLFAEGKILHISLQTRDAKTNQVISRTEDVNASEVGVVIVDPWNYHWCMTACERVSAMVPRWNKAVEIARKMGMPVIWCPSDVIGSYSGYPQREAALGLKLLPVPNEREMPDAKFEPLGAGCMCGPGISCLGNYGHDGMNPDLFISDNDFIASSTEEVYSLLKTHDITHVIYMGLHTNICLYGKPGALKFMWQAGLKCMLARDINDAFTHYDPVTGFTPDYGTQQTDEVIERAGIPTINVVDEWRKAGLWNDNWIVETVRITPWGKPGRPYFFKGSVAVTLTTPWLKDVEIHYTLDGSKPQISSPLYKGALKITSATSLQTAAFRTGKLISIPTSAYFVLLPAEPPKPDIYLDDLEYVMDPYGNVGPTYAACLWLPKKGLSYDNQKLKIRKKIYDKGLGFLAPSAVRYELKPEYARFVSKAGIDDNRIDHDLGRNLVMHCSVIFRVFIDGKLMAESPVMRISQEPWRFDVKIPKDSRFINLVCMDAGNHNLLNLGNWVDAGFCLSKKSWDDAVADPAAAHLPRPTKVQYNWQEMERAMFVQLDPATLQQGEYDNGTTKLEDIRFEKLDVNEWCDVAKSWGAKEIVFMLAHSGGFCMWPSATTKYHIGNTSYRNGKGDVVKDFAAACRTHGLKAGFYLWSPHTPEVAKEYNFVNAGYKYTPVNTMEESNAILRQRLREIHQRLGSDLVREVWFDHPRHVSASQEMKELFPEAVVMAVACMDPLPTIRWPGTEAGKVKDPCWSTLKKDFLDSRKYPEIKDNLMQDQSVDDPDGDYWAPHEADVPLHDHFWHMRPDALNHRRSVAALMDCYEKSVGRNSFLILNCAPMPDGSIHPDDIKRYREFGEEIDRRFGHPVALTEQVPGDTIMLDLGGMKNIGYTDLWEDYRYGQRIREYVIEGYDGNTWIELARGTSVGHRKIDPVTAKSISKVRVRITKSVGTPLIRKFQVHSPS